MTSVDQKYVLVDLTGGLGNQLFQIANGYRLCKLFNAKICIRIDKFECGQGNHPKKYFTSLYKNIRESFSDIKYNCVYKETQWNYYNYNNEINELFKEHDKIIITGYWQSEQYFPNMKNELCELFDLTHPHIHIPKDVFNTNPELLEINKYSCLLGVRRGDYLKYPHIHNPCGMTYYTKAMSNFPKETKYYIISDDMEWCKKNFIGEQFVFLNIEDDLSTIYVGMLFPSYIISNSSFHWWMSYFSIYKNPKIFAPDKWISLDKSNTIYRSDMIIIERPIETN